MLFIISANLGWWIEGAGSGPACVCSAGALWQLTLLSNIYTDSSWAFNKQDWTNVLLPIMCMLNEMYQQVSGDKKHGNINNVQVLSSLEAAAVPEAVYHDIVPEGIIFCQKAILTSLPKHVRVCYWVRAQVFLNWRSLWKWLVRRAGRKGSGSTACVQWSIPWQNTDWQVSPFLIWRF